MATTYKVTSTDTTSNIQSGTLPYAVFHAVNGDTAAFQVTGRFDLSKEGLALPSGTITFQTGKANGAAVILQGGSITDPTMGGGTAGLTISGDTYVDIDTTLSYSGTTTINGSAVLNGTDSSSGNLSIGTGGTLIVADGGSVAPPVSSSGYPSTTVFNDGTLNVQAGGSINDFVLRNQSDGTLNWGGSIKGASLYNYGQMNLTAAPTGTPLSIYQSGGTFDLGGQTLSGTTLYMVGGTLQNGTYASSSFFYLEGGTVSATLQGSGKADQLGTGDTILSSPNSYTGGTIITGGTLTLTAQGAAGSGTIAFQGTQAASLQIAGSALGTNGKFTNTIASVGTSDTIDVGGIGTAAVSFDYNTDVLTLTRNGAAVETLQLSGNYHGDVFSAASDNGNGTVVSLAGVAPTVSISGVSGATNLVDHVVTGTVDAADAGSTVTVMNGSTAVGSATSDANGNWSLPFVYAGDGSGYTYNLTATDTNATGTGTSAATALALDFTPNRTSFGTVSHDVSHPGGEVYALYEGLLGRAPDAQGAEGWVASLNAGTPVNQIAQAFLASSEAQTTFPSNSDNKSFVDALYQRVLGRPADAAGEQGWISNLKAGESRADVADSFVFSNEHVSQLQPALNAGIYVADANTSEVARLYYGLLDRAPDSGGLAYNTQALNNGTSIQALAQNFINSGEYHSHYANLSDTAFVTALYQNALGRAPDQGGLQTWDSQLAGGASRASVAIGIVESGEAQNHLAGKIETGFHFA